jgi:hypothetical protein
VWILAVPKIADLRQRELERRGRRGGGKRLPLESISAHLDRRESHGNRAVVLGGVGERLRHQPMAEREIGSVGDRRQHYRIISRIDDDQHVAEVLRRRPHQARSADIDLLDQIVEGEAFPFRCLGERIQVDDDDIDGLDTEAGNRLQVVGMIAPRKDAAVDGRMQRLHPAVQHFGKAGQIRDARHVEARPGQRPRRAAGRDQIEAAIHEAAGKVDDSGLIEDAQQGSWHKERALGIKSKLLVSSP